MENQEQMRAAIARVASRLDTLEAQVKSSTSLSSPEGAADLEALKSQVADLTSRLDAATTDLNTATAKIADLEAAAATDAKQDAEIGSELEALAGKADGTAEPATQSAGEGDGAQTSANQDQGGAQ